jgi:hypothetical protein
LRQQRQQLHQTWAVRGGVHQPWQRRNQAVRQQRRAEEALQEKKAALSEKKAALLVLQRKKMYVAAVPLKKGGCEKSRLIILGFCGSDTKLRIIECVRLCLSQPSYLYICGRTRQ